MFSSKDKPKVEELDEQFNVEIGDQTFAIHKNDAKNAKDASKQAQAMYDKIKSNEEQSDAGN